MSVEIRPARPSDVNGYLRLMAEYYEHVSSPSFYDYGLLKRPTRDHLKKWFMRVLGEAKAKQSILLVALEDRNVVAYSFLRPLDIPLTHRSHIGKFGMFVSEKHRNRHIGTELLKVSVDKAKGMFRTLQMGVFAPNKTAKHIYKKFGFRRWGIAPGYIKKGNRYIDEEFMYLNL
jgi:RimJ/RimL family protein N-acetyltransferase